MRNETTEIAVGMLSLLPFVLIMLGCIGWIMNIVKIVWAIQANDLTAMFVARVVGAFIAPIGAVLGFF